MASLKRISRGASARSLPRRDGGHGGRLNTGRTLFRHRLMSPGQACSRLRTCDASTRLRAIADISLAPHTYRWLTFSTTLRPAQIPQKGAEAPAGCRPSRQRQGRKDLLSWVIPAHPRSAPNDQDRPVTPEVAGSSPVAPVRKPCINALVVVAPENVTRTRAANDQKRDGHGAVHRNRSRREPCTDRDASLDPMEMADTVVT